MDRKVWAFAVWIPAILLIFFFVSFGLSDITNPRSAMEYASTNPLRPFFRLAFGLVMSSITLFSAILIMAKCLVR